VAAPPARETGWRVRLSASGAPAPSSHRAARRRHGRRGLAEQKIPAGTAALLLASVPVWMIITSRVVDSERISILTAGGLVLA